MATRKRPLTEFLEAAEADDTPDPAPSAGPVVSLRDRAETATSAAATRLALATSPEEGQGAAVAAPRRARARHPSPAAGWARPAVIDAHNSARQTPKGWTGYTLNLPASVMNRLNNFIPDDHDATGLRSLHACHYIQAALSRLPDDLDKAAALGQAWQANHLLDRGGMAGGSGTRLQLDTATAVQRLVPRLRTLPYKVRLWEVAAALVTALLDDLGAP